MDNVVFYCGYYKFILKENNIKYVYFGTWSKASRLMQDSNTRNIVYSN